jgi:hypothetical protein
VAELVRQREAAARRRLGRVQIDVALGWKQRAGDAELALVDD